MKNSLPLHLCHVQKSSLIINRLHTFLHGIGLLALIRYRISNLSQITKIKELPQIFPHVLVFASELVLCFLWLLNQAYLWRPIYRTVFPERLPGDDKLPAIDVFICTADPNKEPTLQVMNTVISAMALDYPPEKLHVYLSDDGGSSLTLFATREARKFARLWLPFCRKYEVKTRCPAAYFSATHEVVSQGSFISSSEFMAKKGEIKKQYEMFKDRVQKFKESSSAIMTSKDHPHPPSIEVVRDAATDSTDVDQPEIPLLIYVSREKKPSCPHHFKAGALNVLLRVSGIISNSPCILVLDCDMYCNDPTSARQAMCFHLDRKMLPKLAFVQFPQKFNNISENDIYDSQLRSLFKVRWYGLDGLEGPVLSGTGFYIKREALFGVSNKDEDFDLVQLQKSLGPSNEFIKSLHQNNRSIVPKSEELSGALLRETQFLASCTYENHTQWGKQVGFRYFSVVEDYFTGFTIHSKGWTSVYLDPPRPAFLGSATTNLNDFLVQHSRWSAGLAEVGLSKYSPLLYGPPRMSILHSMCYAELAHSPFYFFPLICLATIPQICLLHDIPLYPGVSNSIFPVFAFLFFSSNLKHIQEVLYSGNSIWTWIYEQRMWMIKSVTCYFYGNLNAILEKIGAKEASFQPTNKEIDEGQFQRYQLGIFDFQASKMFITPMCTLVILNALTLFIGLAKMISSRNFEEMFIQAFISFFILVMQYPVIEGMFLRKDEGRVPQSAALQSAVLALIILSLGHGKANKLLIMPAISAS